MARSFTAHHGPPPPDVIATGEGWLNHKLSCELDVLSNLIYLAQREPDQCERYLGIAHEIVARIRLMVQECRLSQAA